jgi:small-conductance mechanosensitive channel
LRFKIIARLLGIVAALGLAIGFTVGGLMSNFVAGKHVYSRVE